MSTRCKGFFNSNIGLILLTAIITTAVRDISGYLLSGMGQGEFTVEVKPSDVHPTASDARASFPEASPKEIAIFLEHETNRPNRPKRLDITMVNNSENDVVVLDMAFDITAKGTVPHGDNLTAALRPDARYAVILPDVLPDQPVKGLARPILFEVEPGKAERIEVLLYLPFNVSLTGTYVITPRMITTMGIRELSVIEMTTESTRRLINPETGEYDPYEEPTWIPKAYRPNSA